MKRASVEWPCAVPFAQHTTHTVYMVGKPQDGQSGTALIEHSFVKQRI